MAKDMSSAVRDMVVHIARDALNNIGDAKPEAKQSNGRFSGASGLAAGAGLAALAPLAKKGVDAVRSGGLPTSGGQLVSKAASGAGDKVGSQLKNAVTSKVDEAGGASGLVKDAAGELLPFGGGDDDGGKGGMPGAGKGRRMPVQQSIDVAVPIETAYNQWTQYEDWPEFMHRVTRVTQDDQCTVSFATKIWGKTKEFTANIDTQRPDERIKWRVSQGLTHTGVVTFHELAPRLTRIEVVLDVDPGSLIEKAARGMRHIKRAARADLHRFKAFIEMAEHESGAWRGVIEDGEVVEEHDPEYDEEREYTDIEEFRAEHESSEDEEQDDDEQEGEDQEDEEDDDDQRARSERFKRQAERSRSGSSGGSRSRGSSGGSSRSSRSSSGSNGSGSRSRAAAATRSSSSRSTGGRKSSSSSSKKSGSSSNGRSSSSRSGSSKSSGGSSSKSSGGSSSKSSGGSSSKTKSSGGSSSKRSGGSTKRSGGSTTAKRKTASRS